MLTADTRGPSWYYGSRRFPVAVGEEGRHVADRDGPKVLITAIIVGLQ